MAIYVETGKKTNIMEILIGWNMQLNLYFNDIVTTRLLYFL